jgi:hypothetical protein
VAIARSDAKLLAVAAIAVVAAGLLVAAVLLIASGRAASPTKYTAFPAGDAVSIKRDLKSGGPYFFPDPFGGNRNILLAVENDKVVALSDIKPGTTNCRVRWKGSVNAFVDCHGDKLQSDDLARYEAVVGQSGANKGELLVDLRHEQPAPAGS